MSTLNLVAAEATPQQPAPPSEFGCVHVAARYVGVSPATLTRWLKMKAAQGDTGRRQIGGCAVYHLPTLRAVVLAQQSDSSVK